MSNNKKTKIDIRKKSLTSLNWCFEQYGGIHSPFAPFRKKCPFPSQNQKCCCPLNQHFTKTVL